MRHPLDKPIQTVVTARTNAELIALACELYVKPTDTIIEPTYGEGKWWTKYKHPGLFIKHDKYTLDGIDFSDLPEYDESVDCFFFDPPYVLTGGRETSTVKDMHKAYGIGDTLEANNMNELYLLIGGGLCEAFRVLKRGPREDQKRTPRGGRLFVKSCSFISSGDFQPAHHRVCEMAEKIGFVWLDEFVHVTGTGPQPKRNRNGTLRVQKHARRAHSYLSVFYKPKLLKPAIVI